MLLLLVVFMPHPPVYTTFSNQCVCRVVNLPTFFQKQRDISEGGASTKADNEMLRDRVMIAALVNGEVKE